jgi:hypothetical protein
MQEHCQRQSHWLKIFGYRSKIDLANRQGREMTIRDLVQMWDRSAALQEFWRCDREDICLRLSLLGEHHGDRLQNASTTAGS